MRTSKTVSETGSEYVSFVSCWMRRSIGTSGRGRGGSSRPGAGAGVSPVESCVEISLVDLVGDEVAGVLDADEERGEPLAEDLAHVDVAELAVEPTEPSLGLGGVAVVIAAAGDLME